MSDEFGVVGEAVFTAAAVFIIIAFMIKRQPERRKPSPRASLCPQHNDYDAVVNIDWFTSLINQPDKNECDENEPDRIQPDLGWKVTRNDVESTDTLCIGVFGLYNQGKTFVINHIAETNLPEGIDQHTDGISLKRANNMLKRFTLVDIAGFQAPVEDTKGNHTLQLNHRHAIDQFIEAVVLHMTVGYIVVIGDLKLDDQLYLNDLRKKLHVFNAQFATHSNSGDMQSTKESRMRDLIVIHNFAKENDCRKCEIAFRKQITKNYTNGHWVKGKHVNYYVSKEVGGKEGMAGMRHVFIGRCSNVSNTPVIDNGDDMNEHNNSVFELIRDWLINVLSQDRQDVRLIEEIVQCCNTVLKTHATSTQPPQLIFDETKSVVCFEKPVSVSKIEEEFKFLYDEKTLDLRPPKEPPYDLLRVGDAVYIHLDAGARNVTLDYNPHRSKVEVEGFFPSSKHYADKTLQSVIRKRFIGDFKFTVDLYRVPTAPPLYEPEMEDEDIEENHTIEKTDTKTVIKFKIQQRVTNKKKLT